MNVKESEDRNSLVKNDPRSVPGIHIDNDGSTGIPTADGIRHQTPQTICDMRLGTSSTAVETGYNNTAVPSMKPTLAHRQSMPFTTVDTDHEMTSSHDPYSPRHEHRQRCGSSSYPVRDHQRFIAHDLSSLRADAYLKLKGSSGRWRMNSGDSRDSADTLGE